MPARLRRFLHIAAAVVLHYSGALALWSWFRRSFLAKDACCVLGLHRVLSKTEQERSDSLEAMVIRDNTYLDLLAYLKRRFRVLAFDDFIAMDAEKAPSHAPGCLITFDDGWADTYSRAFPGLKANSLPAVVFLATGAIGTSGGFWVERVKRAWKTPPCRERLLSAANNNGSLGATPNGDAALEDFVEWLKRMPAAKREAILERGLLADPGAGSAQQVDAMLTWEQAREMSRAGVEIGAHTVNHPLLTYEDPLSIERELALSKRTLEEKLGAQVRAFAYPNGDWNEQVREQVEKTGYRCAFTTHPAWHHGRENSYAISRVLLHEGNITARDGEFSPAMLNLTLAGWA